MLVLFLVDYILHQRQATVSQYYYIVIAFWTLTQMIGDTLLIYALYTFLTKRPSPAPPGGKCNRSFQIVALILWAVLVVLAIVEIGLASAGSAYTVDPSLTLGSIESLFDSLSKVDAAYRILYWILNVELWILAWIAFARERSSNPGSKVSTTLENSILAKPK
jgi:hypothetical protein